jgi:hypothetical protein
MNFPTQNQLSDLVKFGLIIFTGVVFTSSVFTGTATADSNFSAGIWGTYQYLPDDEANTNTGGEFTGEALIIYADGEAEEDANWLYSAEMRFGPGSFTDPDNNSTGDEFTLHKAWVGWQLNAEHVLRVGKSQVPFGWKTQNFLPGDILLAGFGDQMDVGLKLSGQQSGWQYDLAYYLSDDWGSTSTDTVDDNRHWGSSTSYRKVQTWVGNLAWDIHPDNRVGLSLQSGKLQDLTGTPDKPTSGSHQAYVFYLEGTHNNTFYKASYTQHRRELPDAYQANASLPDDIENSRLAAEVGYNWGDWAFYLDASYADPDTSGNNAGSITAFAPGARYDYGPGWIYIEHLTQDGFIDRDGKVNEGDFEALYISLDFYF